MANPEHLAKLKEGVQAWNEWRAKNPHLLPDLGGAQLRRADLRRADLKGADLSRADLNGADLSRADIIWADLNGADLGIANLRGTMLGAANLYRADLVGADLCGADLHGADISRADISAAKLSGTMLRGADLNGADLTRADLTGADLAGANLTAAKLSEVRLGGADLSGAKLRAANLNGANVAGTRFIETSTRHTEWYDLDLSESVALDSIVHEGPSSVGIDTLVKSKGRIPEVFLRGCGVPEHIIAMQKSLVGDISPIQFYSCFISYSHKDEEFCQRLHSRMQQEGLRVWYAPEEMKGGRKLHEQIDDAIRVYDKLLVVLSAASMESEWVVTEIRKARKRERSENRQVLFPIRLVSFEAIRDWERFDADTGKDMASEIREYFIPDFSNWKDHDDFEAAFARLLKDLKASA